GVRLLELGAGDDHGGIVVGRCGWRGYFLGAGVQDFRKSLNFDFVFQRQELVVGNGFEKGVGFGVASILSRLLGIMKTLAAVLPLGQSGLIKLDELSQLLPLLFGQVVLAGLGLSEVRSGRFIVGLAITLHAHVERGMGSRRTRRRLADHAVK